MASEKDRDADEKFCSHCGEAIAVKAEICPKCGVRQPVIETALAESTLRTATVLAAILGFIGFMGIGHMYAGNVGRGIALLLGGWVLWILFWVTIWLLVGIVFIPIGVALWIWSIYDVRSIIKSQSTVGHSHDT